MGREKARKKERNGESQIYLTKTATDTPMRTNGTRRGLGAGEGGHSNLYNPQSDKLSKELNALLAIIRPSKMSKF